MNYHKNYDNQSTPVEDNSQIHRKILDAPLVKSHQRYIM